MRQVSRLAHRTRLAPRGRPKPRWLRPAQLAAASLAVVAALGFGVQTLHRLGILSDAVKATQARLLDLSGRLGLVVEHIYAEGRERTNERELVQSLERYQGVFILSVDTAAVKERLESLPWVRQATVSRQFPTTLLVRIEEHRPLAVWVNDGRRRLIGQDGEVVSVNDVGRFRSLPVLRGAGAPMRAQALFRVLDAEPALARRLTQATLIGDRRWNVWLDHRIEVRLPEEGAEEAWRFLAKRQRETALLSRAVEAIDLRNPSWLVLRLMDEKAPATGQGV
jgi:cell division protein FtsQ